MTRMWTPRSASLWRQPAPETSATARSGPPMSRTWSACVPGRPVRKPSERLTGQYRAVAALGLGLVQRRIGGGNGAVEVPAADRRNAVADGGQGETCRRLRGPEALADLSGNGLDLVRP